MATALPEIPCVGAAPGIQSRESYMKRALLKLACFAPFLLAMDLAAQRLPRTRPPPPPVPAPEPASKPNEIRIVNGKFYNIAHSTNWTRLDWAEGALSLTVVEVIREGVIFESYGSIDN